MRMGCAWAVPLLVLLAGCQVAPPPSRRSSLVTLREAHRSAFQADREGQRSAAAAVRWSFSTTAGECVARTSGSSRSPALTVRVDHIVHLAMTPGGGASRLAFSGPGGSWTLRAAGRGRSTTATLPLDEGAVTRLLALLEGGQLRLGEGTRPATLLLPDAGVSGRDWIGCVSAKAREASSTAGR
jgi:hypothetical protein